MCTSSNTWFLRPTRSTLPSNGILVGSVIFVGLTDECEYRKTFEDSLFLYLDGALQMAEVLHFIIISSRGFSCRSDKKAHGYRRTCYVVWVVVESFVAWTKSLYYYYEDRTHNTHTGRKTDKQTDREWIQNNTPSIKSNIAYKYIKWCTEYQLQCKNQAE